jgi:hypothetical protein
MESAMTQEQKVMCAKVGILELAKQLGNVSQACRVMGYSRDSVYRFKEVYDKGGEAAPQEISRRRPLLKNRVDPVIEEAVGRPGAAGLRPGAHRHEVPRRHALAVSPQGSHSIWLRHDLETMTKRLKALEAKSAREGWCSPSRSWRRWSAPDWTRNRTASSDSDQA